MSASIPLGQKSTYPTQYDNGLLYPIERNRQREAMAFPKVMPFFGYDIWNAYELSWLSLKNKPERRLLTLVIPADSPFLLESKSLKLYFNSFNLTNFANENDVLDIIISDLSSAAQKEIRAYFGDPDILRLEKHSNNFICLDNLDIEIEQLTYDKKLLNFSQETVKKHLYSSLFKSHCLVTGQPDWATIYISYEGQNICEKSLLKYLVSFNRHQGFSENVIEQAFIDIFSLINPKYLSIYGRFTRRGGIDINPLRSTENNITIHNVRDIFQ